MTHLLLLVLFATSTAGGPSRAPDKGCKWEKFSDIGLEAWVERCDYGFRKIDFLRAVRAFQQRKRRFGG